MHRRDFLKVLAASGTVLSAPLLTRCNGSKNGLNILVLGGTNFLGPAVVKAALQNGHQLTLFNRGITNPELFPDLPLIRGDREDGQRAYDLIKNKKWDAVIDVWPEHSKLVDEATMTLKKNTAHYVFISSIGVYQNFQEVGLHEGSAVVALEADKKNWGYSEEKIAAEQLVEKRFPINHSILRPGPIKGWRDSALDLLYWIIKLKKNENIIGPGSGKDPLQFIDVNDVGAFAIKTVEKKLNGIYNCVGPREVPLLWDEFIGIAKKYLNSTSEIYWANEGFLRKNKVRSFEDLPLWAPLSEDRGFMQISNKKSTEAGFKFTPLEKTFADCLSWFEKNMDKNIKFGTEAISLGLERNRELQLIKMIKN